MKKKLILLFCAAAAFIALSFTKPADRYFEIAKNLDIFATLFKEVNALYVDEVNPNQLIRTGIDAMLASLDPYTNYIPEDEVEDYRTINTGQYGGIGAITREIGKRTVVTMIIGSKIGEVNICNVISDHSKKRNVVDFYLFAPELKIGDEILKIDRELRLPSPYAGTFREGTDIRLCH